MKTPPVEKEAYGSGTPKHRAHRLRLYITGATPRSTQAIENITAIGKTHRSDRLDPEAINSYQQSELIRNEQIVVLRSLIRQLPLPIRRMVGDLPDEDRVLVGLRLVAKEQGSGH